MLHHEHCLHQSPVSLIVMEHELSAQKSSSKQQIIVDIAALVSGMTSNNLSTPRRSPRCQDPFLYQIVPVLPQHEHIAPDMQKLVEQGKDYSVREALMAFVALLSCSELCSRNLDKDPLLYQLLHINQARLSDAEQVAIELVTVSSLENSML